MPEPRELARLSSPTRRELRRRLDELCPGRERRRDIRPAVRQRGRAAGWRVPGEIVHNERPTLQFAHEGQGRRSRCIMREYEVRRVLPELPVQRQLERLRPIVPRSVQVLWYQHQ